jgi:hypothetical protein
MCDRLLAYELVCLVIVQCHLWARVSVTKSNVRLDQFQFSVQHMHGKQHTDATVSTISLRRCG